MAKNVNSRRKGATFEREVAAILREHGFTDARRGQQYNGRNGDADVVGGPAGLHLECKRAEAFRWNEWWQQATEDARPGEIPVVVWRKSRMEPMATLRLVDLLDLLRRQEGGESNDA